MVYWSGVIFLDEKWLLEQAAAENFVSAINKMYTTSYEILKHTDKPDILIGDKKHFDRYESYINVPDSDYRHIWLLFFDFENREWNTIKTLR